jgi:hypothetical protein
MKLLADYSEDELVNLGDDEKQTMFLLECAERGVPLPDTIPTYMQSPDERDDLKPDQVVYTVTSGRYSSDKWYFKTLEEAEAVATLIRQTAISISHDYRNSKSTYYLGEGEITVDINTDPVYSANKYAQVKEEISIYEQRKDAVDRNNKRRSEIMSKQAEVMSEINDSVYEAEKNITRLGELKRIFEQYLRMANNDHEVAVRFLLNAHYGEISDYDDDKLPRIGITKEDVNKYLEISKAKAEEETQ